MPLPSHNHPDGQNHDRFHVRPQDEGVETMPLTPPDVVTHQTVGSAANTDLNMETDITVVQRMLSATTGSFLTGLLVTPLDVVRVRWQSQTLSKPVIDFERLPANFRKIAAESTQAFRPADLGVTACCREVFFMNANTEMCLAGPKEAAAAAAAASVAAFPDCAVEQHEQKTFHSTLDGMRKIARQEGLSTLWRGLSATLIMSVPANIIYFTGYEWLRYDQHSPIHRTTSEQYAPLVAGSTARTLAAATVSPIELFRTRLQASQGSSSAAGHLQDTLSGLRSMVQTHGYRSLWRGLTLTLWRDVPFSGMYWWGYEAVRGELTRARDRATLGGTTKSGSGGGSSTTTTTTTTNHTETFLDSFTAGALSGAVASIATMPFDVGKTRTQVFRDGLDGLAPTTVPAATMAAAAAKPEEQTMTRLLWHIFRTEGMGGLFRGWIPRTLKVAPACAIMISSYEVGKKVFRSMNEREE